MIALRHWLCRKDAHTSTNTHKFPLSTPSIHGCFPSRLSVNSSSAGPITAPVWFELFARPDRTLRQESSLTGGGNSLGDIGRTSKAAGMKLPLTGLT